MIRRAAVLLLVSGVLATSGCCCGWVYRPFGPGTLCDTSNCGGCAPCGPGFGPACGPVCGPVCATPCDSCGTPCGDECGAPCGDPCGSCGPPCGGPIAWRHPLLAAIFHPLQWGGCGAGGCGELYLGDFHSNPPDCCDPCNRCGDWTGGGPVMDYAAGPVMEGPVMSSSPAPAAPTSGCTNCGKSHASAKVPSQGYASSRPPRMVSQTSGLVPTRPRQGNVFAPSQTVMRPSTTVMR